MSPVLENGQTRTFLFSAGTGAPAATLHRCVSPASLLRSRRALLVSVAIAAASPAAAHAAAPPLVVGIADQKPDMFTDPLFTGLGLRDARISVAWDVLHYGWQRRELDAWMTAAHAAGVRPLLTFDHSRIKARTRILPRPERLAHELRMVRRRYPWARQFAAWNEANYCGEKTCHRPELVAAYYHALKQACPSCRILVDVVEVFL